MRHDHDPTSRYHADNMQMPKGDPGPAPDPAVKRTAGKIGELIGYAIIGLAAFLVASGLLAGIVALWRVIL